MVDRGGCEQICVLSHRSDNGGLGYRCKCRMGYDLHADGKRCLGNLTNVSWWVIIFHVWLIHLWGCRGSCSQWQQSCRPDTETKKPLFKTLLYLLTCIVGGSGSLVVKKAEAEYISQLFSLSIYSCPPVSAVLQSAGCERNPLQPLHTGRHHPAHHWSPFLLCWGGF